MVSATLTIGTESKLNSDTNFFAEAQKNISGSVKQKEFYQSGKQNYENALEIWRTGGAQIAPGVSDAQRLEIVKRKVELSANYLNTAS